MTSIFRIKTRHFLFVPFMLTVSMFLLAFQPISQNQYCNMVLEPVRPGQNSSTIVSYRCFATDAEALFAGTNGKVRVSPTASREEIDAAILAYNASLDGVRVPLGINSQTIVTPNLHSNQLLSRDYDGANFTGAVFSLYSCSTCGNCSEGYQYLIADLGTWNDRIESARVYENGCRYFYHYQLTNYGQPLIDCGYPTSCSGMGVLANHIRSTKLYY